MMPCHLIMSLLYHVPFNNPFYFRTFQAVVFGFTICCSSFPPRNEMQIYFAMRWKQTDSRCSPKAQRTEQAIPLHLRLTKHTAFIGDKSFEQRSTRLPCQVAEVLLALHYIIHTNEIN